VTRFLSRQRRLQIEIFALCTFGLCALSVGQSPPAGPPTGSTNDTEAEQSAAATAPVHVSERVLYVPEEIAHQPAANLHARLCLPDNSAAATLVLINHGSPAQASARPKMELGRCDQEAAQWFLARGYAVAFVLRRGYGETGGAWAEDTGGCAQPDFVRAGLETARDINAAVDFLTRQPQVRSDGVVVVGQSAGGWGAIAYASIAPPKVAAFVVMAGGRGGHHDNRPRDNCRPDLLAQAAGHFGKTARTPMLWIYTENDSYFAPPIARAMYQEFSAKGGVAHFERLGPYGADGHKLFFGPGGPATWGPLVERYLADRHVAPY
jgi:dienelactone hydrolase